MRFSTLHYVQGSDFLRAYFGSYRKRMSFKVRVVYVAQSLICQFSSDFPANVFDGFARICKTEQLLKSVRNFSENSELPHSAEHPLVIRSERKIQQKHH